MPAAGGPPAPDGATGESPGPASAAHIGREPAHRRARLGALIAVVAVVAALDGGSTIQGRDAAAVAASVPTNAVTELDASGTVLASTPVGTNPIALASSKTAIWVVNAGDDTVSEIDPSTARGHAEARCRPRPARLGRHGRRPLGHQLLRRDRVPHQRPRRPAGGHHPRGQRAGRDRGGTGRALGRQQPRQHDPEDRHDDRGTLRPRRRRRGPGRAGRGRHLGVGGQRPLRFGDAGRRADRGPAAGTDPGGQRTSRHRPARRRRVGGQQSSPRASPGSRPPPDTRTRSTSGTGPPRSPSSADRSGWPTSTPATCSESTPPPRRGTASTSVHRSTTWRSRTVASGSPRAPLPRPATAAGPCGSRPASCRGTPATSTPPAPTTCGPPRRSGSSTTACWPTTTAVRTRRCSSPTWRWRCPNPPTATGPTPSTSDRGSGTRRVPRCGPPT